MRLFPTVVLLSFLSLAARAQTVPDNRIAEPGVRFGRVFLGDSRAAVERRLGKPGQTQVRGRGLILQTWFSKPNSDTGGRNTLEVLYRQNCVVQIAGTSLVWQTPRALSLSSPRREWEEMFGKPVQRTYMSSENGRGVRYLDWKRAGVALELAEEDERENVYTFHSLIVHRRGAPVIIDRDLERQ